MLSVAFFRNLNQGQRGDPTSTQLLEAFSQSGAKDVLPFQSNGTVLFDSPLPQECMNDAVARLVTSSPWNDVAFMRSAEWLVAYLTALALDQSAFTRAELSLFDESRSPIEHLPLAGKRCMVVSGGFGFALTENERAGESNATPSLERALDVKVTSRSLLTLSRLADRLPG